MKIIDLKKTVGDFTLDIANLKIEEGKVHGFIGGNGCGKTTLCKLIMGVIDADEGYVDYEGLSLRDVTLTAQRPYFIGASVYENICYPLKIRGITPDEKKIDEWLEKCGLASKKHQYARSLSSGEQQKVSMIRALIFEPKFIMIDESLSNLDPEAFELFVDIIMQRQRENPVTWILISHRLAHIYKICDVIHFLYKGRVIKSGSTDEVLFESGDERIRSFVSNEVIQREENNGTVKG